jgi:hypothetical protein
VFWYILSDVRFDLFESLGMTCRGGDRGIIIPVAAHWTCAGVSQMLRNDWWNWFFLAINCVLFALFGYQVGCVVGATQPSLPGFSALRG